jgi:hypothetical protein
MLRLSTQFCVFLALAVFCLTPALAQDDVYYPDNYTASSNVENFHNMPRFSGGNDFDYESQEYIIGVVSTAVIFFAIAVLMLIFIPIWYLCSCMAQCFGKCCCSSEEKATHQSSWFVRIMWGIALVGVLVGVSVGMEGNEVASQGAAETADIIVDGAVFFERAVDIVIDAIAVLDEASQELDDLESACILFQVDGTSEFFEETFTATNASLSGFYTDVNGFSTDMRILGDTVVDGDAQRHDWTL